MKLLYSFLFLVCALNQTVFAQQQGMYTQYMFNGLALNPAYAGSHETLSLTALARKQWTGIKGSPSTQTFSAHSPLKSNDKVSLGFIFSNDQIAVTKQINVNAVYAYRIKLGPGKLSMGLQGGFSNYNNALTKIYLGPGKTDQNFNENTSSFTPVFGAGLYYHTKQYYAGISSPQLISYKEKSFEGVDMKQISHYFITGGYVFDLNKSLKLKPNVLLKMVTGAPIQIDINANLLINNKIWTGLSYRSMESLSAIFQVDITEELRFGYSYDFPVGSRLSSLNGGSHEIMLNYSFPISKAKSTIFNPRYF